MVSRAKRMKRSGVRRKQKAKRRYQLAHPELRGNFSAKHKANPGGSNGKK